MEIKSVFTSTASSQSAINIRRQLWLYNATGGNLTHLLPSAAVCSGIEVAIVKIDASVNTVTINTTSSQVIYSTAGLVATSAVLATVGKSVTLTSDGAHWIQTASQ